MHQYLLTCWTLWSTSYAISFTCVRMYVCVGLRMWVGVSISIVNSWTPNKMEIIDLKFSTFDLFVLCVGCGRFMKMPTIQMMLYYYNTILFWLLNMDASIVYVLCTIYTASWVLEVCCFRIWIDHHHYHSTNTAGIKWPLTPQTALTTKNRRSNRHGYVIQCVSHSLKFDF